MVQAADLQEVGEEVSTRLHRGQAEVVKPASKHPTTIGQIININEHPSGGGKSQALEPASTRTWVERPEESVRRVRHLPPSARTNKIKKSREGTEGERGTCVRACMHACLC